MKVRSLLFAFACSWFFFPVVLPHKSLLPLLILLPLSFLHAVRNAASARHSFFAVLFAAAAVFVFFIETSQTQWHVSINIAMFESASSFSFQIFISSRFVFIVFLASCMLGKSVNLFELLPASFTRAICRFLGFPVLSYVFLITRSLPFVPASLSRLSTAHSRCDEFF